MNINQFNALALKSGCYTLINAVESMLADIAINVYYTMEHGSRDETMQRFSAPLQHSEDHLSLEGAVLSATIVKNYSKRRYSVTFALDSKGHPIGNDKIEIAYRTIAVWLKHNGYDNPRCEIMPSFTIPLALPGYMPLNY